MTSTRPIDDGNSNVPSPESDAETARRVAKVQRALRDPAVLSWHRDHDDQGVDARIELVRTSLHANSQRIHRRVPLAAIAASALLGAAALLLLDGARPIAPSIRRVLTAIASGVDPAPEDAANLTRWIPNPALRASLLRDPRSDENWARLEEQLPDRHRGPESVVATLVAPRAGVVGGRPKFVISFGNNDPGHTKCTLRIVMSNRDPIEIPFQPALPESAIDLPPGVTFADGDAGAWTAILHPSGSPTPIAPPATFHIVPAQDQARARSIPRSGDAEIDALIRAASLLTADLAAEAHAELAPLPHPSPLATLLLAEAQARLGHRNHFERLSPRQK